MNADTLLGQTNLQVLFATVQTTLITLADHNGLLWFILKDLRFCTMAQFLKQKFVKYELKPQAMYGLYLNDKSED